MKTTCICWFRCRKTVAAINQWNSSKQRKLQLLINARVCVCLSVCVQVSAVECQQSREGNSSARERQRERQKESAKQLRDRFIYWESAFAQAHDKAIPEIDDAKQRAKCKRACKTMTATPTATLTATAAVQQKLNQKGKGKWQKATWIRNVLHFACR